MYNNKYEPYFSSIPIVSKYLHHKKQNKFLINLQIINRRDGYSFPPSFFPLKNMNHCTGSTLTPYLEQEETRFYILIRILISLVEYFLHKIYQISMKYILRAYCRAKETLLHGQTILTNFFTLINQCFLHKIS